MRKSSVLLFSLAVLFSTGAWIARTQAPQTPAQLTLEKVKDNLYVIIGDGGNILGAQLLMQLENALGGGAAAMDEQERGVGIPRRWAGA